MTRAHYLRMATASGISVKEALLMPPGEVSDVFELYLRARGVKKEREPEAE